MRWLLAIAISIILQSCSVAPALAAECKGCDALGLTAKFVYRGGYTLKWATDFCKRNPTECKPVDETEVVADDALFAKMDFVKALVDQVIVQKNDSEIWGVDEYWATAAETLRKKAGDCEDIVQLVKALLVEQGVPAGALHIIHIKIKPFDTNNGHAVLGVNTDRGYFVIDNRYPGVRTIFSAGEYRMVGVQVPAAPDQFHAIDGARM